MARILVQTNDHSTVLDERDVQVSDISDENSAVNLLNRVEEAICDAESRRAGRSPRIRRLAMIAPTSDYREAHG